MLNAFPVTTFPIYPGLGQAPNMLTCIPNGLVKRMPVKQKLKAVVEVVVAVLYACCQILLDLPYSRRLEEEADAVGLQLMAKVRSICCVTQP